MVSLKKNLKQYFAPISKITDFVFRFYKSLCKVLEIALKAFGSGNKKRDYVILSLKEEKSGSAPSQGVGNPSIGSIWGAHQIPNALCVFRVLLVYVSMYFLLDVYLSEGRVSFFWLALATVGALTDKLDGFLAKRYGWESRLGAYLDQMSDKMVTFVVYTALTIITEVGGFLLAGIVFRELLVTGLRTVGNKINVAVPTSQAGKLKTFYQQVAAGVLAVNWALSKEAFGFSYVQYVVWIGLGAFWLTMIAKRKKAFPWLRSVYEVRLKVSQEETVSSFLDYWLVVSCFLLAVVPFDWIGAASVLYLTLGTGVTYLYNFIHTARYELGMGGKTERKNGLTGGGESSRGGGFSVGRGSSVWGWVGLDIAISVVLSGLLWLMVDLYRDSTIVMAGVVFGYSLLFGVFLIINYRDSVRSGL